MPKKKYGRISFDGDWKRISLGVPFTLEENGESFPLEDLIEIEELTDYHIEADGNISVREDEDTEDIEAVSTRRSKKKRRSDVDGDDESPAKRSKTDQVQETYKPVKSASERLAKARKKEKLRAKKKKAKAKQDALEGTNGDGSRVPPGIKLRPGENVVAEKAKKRKKPAKKAMMASVSESADEVIDDVLDVSSLPHDSSPPDDEVDTEEECSAEPGLGVEKRTKTGRSGKVSRQEPPVEPGSADRGSSPNDTSLAQWEQLRVADYIVKALNDLNFTKPTPIQEQCLPSAISSRKDIVGAAETGSGKTLAFAIPIVQNIVEDRKNEVEKEVDQKYLRALIITPTRELAVQIKQHIQAVTKHTDVTTCLVVGGMFKEKQDRLLKRCPDIVIATPGRLYDHIQQNTPHLSELSRLRYLVLDEADRMVEHGHFQELTKIMERANEDARAAAKRQNFIFSATLCLDLAKSEKKKWEKAEEERSKVGNLSQLMHVKNNAKVVNLSKPEGTAGALTELRLPCTTKDKDYYFYYLLMSEATGRTIIFCNSLDCVRRLYGVFSYLLSETKRTPLVLHAGMHQKQRLKNLERFHANPKGVLLASDVASRGLDIPNVQYVIHYQVPRNPDLYVHRSGRTARAFKVGTSVLLVDPSDASAYNKILRCLNREKDFAVVDVDVKLFRFAKERVDLSRRIDFVEHQLRKESSKDEWFIKAAEESGLVLDDDDVKNLDIQAGSQKSAKSKESRALKQQLKFMLSQPIKSNMPGFSRKYPALNFARKQMGL